MDGQKSMCTEHDAQTEMSGQAALDSRSQTRHVRQSGVGASVVRESVLMMASHSSRNNGGEL